ncbi:MAG: starch-binding protein, partial [Lachnospiraceae bacterium]|nr:starch-binding protein [Lachnospiraceae bacterium]
MKKGSMNRGLSIILAVIMIFSSSVYDFPGVIDTYAAEKVEFTEDTADISLDVASDYGLADNIQDGVILHCFDWKYNDIKAELPNIAEAGFTSVQTSPAQRDDSFGVWYMLYQPQSFSISTNALGSKEELKSLCEEAEKYGIKVIVDVVANHMRGDGNDVDANMSRNNHSDYWHHDDLDSDRNIDWTNRYQVTHGRIGMYDLNSEHSEVQNIIGNYVKELQGVGVDGIRWDAAKHISLPSESCNFWPAVTSQGLYHYGEILKGPDDRESGNEELMKEYSKYMSVTDSDYGKQLRDAFNSGQAPSSYGNWAAKGVANNKLVYWGESHDTWSNNKDWGYSNEMSQNVIDRAYAVAASRKDITALYFSRPGSANKTSIIAGQKGSTHFTSTEVAAINHFHNAMIGQKDYYTASNGCAVVCREKGAVVVKGSGSGQVSVTNGGSTTAPGTYIDEITGNEWTVTASTISGTIGSSGIAVIYNPKPAGPSVSISKEGGSFSGDTLKLTIGLKNATSGTYKIGNAAAETYTSTKEIIIGSDMAFGDSVKITLTATDGTTTETKEYTFTKVDKVFNKAYLAKPSDWPDTVYCYAYDSATEEVNNAEWPGIQMTKDSDTGYYVYEIPENIEKPRVIFNCGIADNNVHRYPADMEKGSLFETDGSWIYKDGKWEKYNSPVGEQGKVIVNYVDDSG